MSNGIVQHYDFEQIWALAAEVLDRPLPAVERNGSFLALGGTSLRAAELAVLTRSKFNRSLNLERLLSADRLEAVIASSTVVDDTPDTPLDAVHAAGSGNLLEVSCGQETLLLADDVLQSRAGHLLFCAIYRPTTDAPLINVNALRHAVERALNSDSMLRSVFVRTTDGYRRKVTRQHHQVTVRWLEDGQAPEESLASDQQLLSEASQALLRPFATSPINAWLVAEPGGAAVAIHVLAHHALLDGYSFQLLCRRFAEIYQSPNTPPDYLADDGVYQRFVHHERSPRLESQLARRRARAFGVVEQSPELSASQVRLGSRRLIPISDRLNAGLRDVANRCGVTRNAVLLAAWLTLLRRRQLASDPVIAVANLGRSFAPEWQSLGHYTHILPLRGPVDDTMSCDNFIRLTHAELSAVAADASLPLERLLPSPSPHQPTSRTPRYAFASHSEFLVGGKHDGLSWSIVEGHCGGTYYEACLFSQRESEPATLAIEYDTVAIGPIKATLLADGLIAVLSEFIDRPSVEVGQLSIAGRYELDLLERCSAPTEPTGVDTSVASIWDAFVAVATSSPDATAFNSGTAAMSFYELQEEAERTAAWLYQLGVRANDRVGLQVERGPDEIVLVLAILRIGATYVAIDGSLPSHLRERIINRANIVRIIGDGSGPRDFSVGYTLFSHVAASMALPPYIGSSSPAYICFTSGTSGDPKGVSVGHNAILRLVGANGPVHEEASRRFLRLAPLAFDASTLELFVPLLRGHTLVAYPGATLDLDGLCNFIANMQVTGCWLTAGLFRVVVEHNTACFANVQQVLTGGDIVSAQSCKRVLDTCPGITVTNGYGPTENTVFTTCHDLHTADSVNEPVPIGRPVPGTGVIVLSEDAKVVPFGVVGELYAFGSGLAEGYVNDTEQTRERFPDPLTGQSYRAYRTGDLVKWSETGELVFCGRVDQQVKIRGFRVELEAVRKTLLELGGVQDVYVVAIGDRDKRILAAIVTDDTTFDIKAARRVAEGRLPSYSIPSIWLPLSRLPLTGNGKVDVTRLTALRNAAGSSLRETEVSDDVKSSGKEPPSRLFDDSERIRRAVEKVWAAVLGHDNFDNDTAFTDVGGDSLQVLRVIVRLGRELPDLHISTGDIYSSPTVSVIVERILSNNVT